jgi:hypothetical protein
MSILLTLASKILQSLKIVQFLLNRYYISVSTTDHSRSQLNPIHSSHSVPIDAQYSWRAYNNLKSKSRIKVADLARGGTNRSSIPAKG